MAFRHSFTNFKDSEPAWGTVKKTTLPRIAYAVKGEPDKVSTWKLPHHYVKNGSGNDDNKRFTDGDLIVHKRGVSAAVAAMNGARTGRPMNIKASERAHLMRHREAIIRQDKRAFLTMEKQVFEEEGFSESDIEDIHAFDEVYLDSVEKSGEIWPLQLLYLAKVYDYYTTDIPVPDFEKPIEEIMKLESIDVEPDKTQHVGICKINPQKRLVMGVVYEPNIIDAHGHFMKVEELETTAHRFMFGLSTGAAGMDFMHSMDKGSGIPVESFLAPVDFTLGTQKIIKGTWLINSFVRDDDVWNRILKGEIRGYSMAGHAEHGDQVAGNPGDQVSKGAHKKPKDEKKKHPYLKGSDNDLAKVLFDKQEWEQKKCEDWLDEYDLKKDSYLPNNWNHVYTQKEAVGFEPGSFFTEEVEKDKGVEFVFGILKEAS